MNEGQSQRIIILPHEAAHDQMPTIDLDIIEEIPLVVGEEVDPLLDMLARVSGALPLLEPAVPGLIDIVGNGLIDIGCNAMGIEIVSLKTNRPLAARLSEDALRFIMLNPNDAVDRSINWLMGSAFGDILHDRYHDDLVERIGATAAQQLANQLWSDVVLAHVLDARRELGTLSERLLYLTYACLYYNLGFCQAKLDGMAKVMERFSRLCMDGNYPIGLMADRKFLVLTA